MARLIAVLAALTTLSVVALRTEQPPPSPRVRIYDADDNHLWNRIHAAFHIRTAPDGSEYGADTVDPLLWRETRYLLTGESAARAVRLLDEFLQSNGERRIADPLKRAVFQHDLWTVFDWLASGSDGSRIERDALMPRVARVLRRVALPRERIEALPDTYAAAVESIASLPRDLLARDGQWFRLGGTARLVPQHSGELGRSAFIVLWSVPGGSAKTMEYLQTLWNFPQHFVADDSFQLARDGEVRTKLNPALPPIPDGTRIALVRKMLLIDDSGVIVPTDLVESVQLRAFPGAVFSEVRMNRAALFAGKSGGLRAVTTDERDFITFSAKGLDVFEHPPWRGPASNPRLIEGCTNCHHVGFEAPIATVLSLPQLLRSAAFVDSRHERWARWWTPQIVAAEAKSRSYEWGILTGLWQSHPR